MRNPLYIIRTITRPCNLHSLTPQFYLAKLWFAGVFIFLLIFALEHISWVHHRLWVHVKTTSVKIDCGYMLELPHIGGSNEYSQSKFLEKIRKLLKSVRKKCSFLHQRANVMWSVDGHITYTRLWKHWRSVNGSHLLPLQDKKYIELINYNKSLFIVILYTFFI